MHASLNATGRAAVILDTGAASHGSGYAGTNKEQTVRQWFIDNTLDSANDTRLFDGVTEPSLVA